MVETKEQQALADALEREPGVVRIEEAHPRETAMVRVDTTETGLQPAIVDGLQAVATAMAAAGVELAGHPFTRYLEWGPGRAVAEIGFPVLRPAPQVGRVGPGRLPGGRVASVVHQGPYETIADTYTRLQAWLAERGHAPTGPMWEYYVTDPDTEPDPAAWRTEVITPID